MTQEEWDEFSRLFHEKGKENCPKVYRTTAVGEPKEYKPLKVDSICRTGATVRLKDFEKTWWENMPFATIRTEEEHLRWREKMIAIGKLKVRKCAVCGMEFETISERITCDNPECRSEQRRINSRKGRAAKKGWRGGIKLKGSSPKKEKKSKEEKE